MGFRLGKDGLCDSDDPTQDTQSLHIENRASVFSDMREGPIRFQRIECEVGYIFVPAAFTGPRAVF